MCRKAADDLIKKNEIDTPINLMKFIRDNKVDSILESDEVCQRLYPLVPEKYRSKEALKYIVCVFTQFLYSLGQISIFRKKYDDSSTVHE